TGNTSQAAASPTQLVQVLSPNGLEKFEQGQSVSVSWRSDGLTPTRTVALVDSGGNGAPGGWQGGAFRTDSGYSSTFSNAVDTSGVSNPAPQTVYQTYSVA